MSDHDLHDRDGGETEDGPLRDVQRDFERERAEDSQQAELPEGAIVWEEPVDAEVIVSPTPPPRRRRPRIWPIFAALIIALWTGSMGQLLVLIPYLIEAASRFRDPERLAEEIMKVTQTPGGFMLIAIPLQLSIAAAAILPARLSPSPFRERLGLKRPRVSLWTMPVIVLSSIPPTMLGIAMATGLTYLLPPDPNLQTLYDNMTPALAAPFVLFIALVPGFTEEAFFRGYMQRRLVDRFGPLHAIAMTSLVFALIHMAPHTILFAFPIGVWLGVIAWKTDSIVPTILCHAAINGAWNIWIIGSMYAEWETAPWPLVLGVVLIGLLCFAWTYRILFPKTPRENVPVGAQLAESPAADRAEATKITGTNADH